MKLTYSFLKDELALQEIRKHKWIESEKLQHEIGFATAAVDWIQKHGQQWQMFRLGKTSQENVFYERRLHRRFSSQLPVQIKIGHHTIDSMTKDLSFIGFSCYLPKPENPGTPVEVDIQFFPFKERSWSSAQHFSSHVERFEQSQKNNQEIFEAFIPFTENMRDVLRLHADSFNG